jgi:hypothetical protein
LLLIGLVLVLGREDKGLMPENALERLSNNPLLIGGGPAMA